MRTIRAVVIAAILTFALAGPAHADLMRTPQKISAVAATPTASPTVRLVHRKKTAGSVVAAVGIGVILVLAAGGSAVRLRRRSRP